MTKRLLLLLVLACAATTVLAQGRGGPANREATVTPVPFERILRSIRSPELVDLLREPQQPAATAVSRRSARKTLRISFSNGVFQSRSLDKHEVTPLVVDGVMYTIQSPTT